MEKSVLKSYTKATVVEKVMHVCMHDAGPNRLLLLNPYDVAVVYSRIA